MSKDWRPGQHGSQPWRLRGVDRQYDLADVLA